MKIIYLIFVLIPNTNIYAKEDCYKQIKVREFIEEFKMSIPFMKIEKKEQNSKLSINCSLYNRISVDDLLEAEQIKDFVYFEDNLIPFGKMKRIKYKVLEK
jgi:hypothetical protein